MRGVSIFEPMVIDMNEAQVRTLDQVRQVVANTQALEFRGADDDEGRYAWIEQVLQRFGDRALSRPHWPRTMPSSGTAHAARSKVASQTGKARYGI